MSLQSLTPDGRQLRISGVPADSFVSSWLWVLAYQGVHGVRRFGVGSAGGQEAVLRVELPSSEIKKRQATAFGGNLVALEASGGTTMSWIGNYSEISTYVALRVSGRSEGVEQRPVGFACVEQDSDAVVVEVGEPEGGAFDVFGEVVGGYL